MLRSSGTKAAAATDSVPKPKKQKAADTLRDFKVADLAFYNGKNGMPIYVGADGLVFDMSSHESGPSSYGPGGAYHVFAGTDASICLATMKMENESGRSLVSELNDTEKKVLNQWVNKFKTKYRVVGLLNDGAHPITCAEAKAQGNIVLLRDFKVEELTPFDGTNGMPIYVGADGYVFDMSSHESGISWYGPGGPYHSFAGKDATISLATHEVDSQDARKSVTELHTAEKDMLEGWISKFRMKYDVVGFLNDGANPTSVSDALQRGYRW